MADIDYDWFVEHKVKSGETLEGIAEKNGLTWQQLALPAHRLGGKDFDS